MEFLAMYIWLCIFIPVILFRCELRLINKRIWMRMPIDRFGREWIEDDETPTPIFDRVFFSLSAVSLIVILLMMGD